TSLCLADEFHGVGHPAFRTIEQVLTDAEAGGQAASARDLRAHHDQLGKFATKVDSELTVVQLLALYSSPAYTKMTARADLRLGELGAHKTFGGAEWMGAYAARNFRIFAKLRRCLRGPAERMLVIYGSAHRPFLQRAFEDQGDVRLVDPLTVLPSPPKVPLPVLR
ncbi:MAG TPA: DUF5694 domain-containing protein, partial [Polyangia bacterium]